MKVQDLMIGDWVAYRNPVNGEYSPIKVENIYGDEFNCELEGWEIIRGKSISDTVPLGLTEDILVKNGWKKHTMLYKNEWYGDIGLFEEHGKFYYMDLKIEYAHQLQHLLRLAGMEKEIAL